MRMRWLPLRASQCHHTLSDKGVRVECGADIGNIAFVHGLVGRVADRSASPPLRLSRANQACRADRVALRNRDGGQPIEAIRQRPAS